METLIGITNACFGGCIAKCSEITNLAERGYPFTFNQSLFDD